MRTLLHGIIMLLLTQSGIAQVSKPKIDSLLHSLDTIASDAAGSPSLIPKVKRQITAHLVYLAVEKAKAELKADLAKLDSVFTAGTTPAQLLDNEKLKASLRFRAIQIYYGNSDGKFTLQYDAIASAACSNGDVNIDITIYKSINNYIKSGAIILFAQRMSLACATIERFPDVVISDDYADHLLYLIDSILNAYTKFNTTANDYAELEKHKVFTDLTDKINFRIKFIKYCYAKM